ncbi:glycosyltransferase [Pediococcus ethanolidurans]|nr:glycosyltransferase [Pediococcus ethanolidurans]
MLDFHLSGIEHAQIKRLNLFHEHHVDAQILTIDYSTIQHQNMNTYKLNSLDLINLFDYFQKATNYHGHRTKLGDISAPRGTQMRQEGNLFKFFRQDHLLMRVEVWHDRYVHQITFYDIFNNPTQIDIYDQRGFLSQRQLLGFDNRLAQRLYYDIDGKLVLKTNFTNSNENFFQLVNYKGKDYFFTSKQNLNTFFFDELAKNDSQQTTFIVDRNFIVESAIFNMKAQARCYFYTHNTVVEDANDPQNSKPFTTINAYLAHQSRVNGLISPTQHQLDDIKQRWHPKFKQYQIPVGSISKKQLNATPVKTSERIPYKLINVARIHEQKRLEDTINVFKLIHDKIPKATLDIHGYVNDVPLSKKLISLVNQLNLNSAITFRNYSSDIDQIYDTAQLFLFTSRYEGYGLAIMEALSHGVPVMSYDINYGPNEIIQSNYDGFLFKQKDISGMANQAIKLLQDQSQLQIMSTHAYASRPQFSNDAAWQAWLPIINERKEEN